MGSPARRVLRIDDDGVVIREGPIDGRSLDCPGGSSRYQLCKKNAGAVDVERVFRINTEPVAYVWNVGQVGLTEQFVDIEASLNR